MPSYLGKLSAGNFTAALLLATACLVLKTYPPFQTDGNKRVLAAEGILHG